MRKGRWGRLKRPLLDSLDSVCSDEAKAQATQSTWCLYSGFRPCPEISPSVNVANASVQYVSFMCVLCACCNHNMYMVCSLHLHCTRILSHADCITMYSVLHQPT